MRAAISLDRPCEVRSPLIARARCAADRWSRLPSMHVLTTTRDLPTGVPLTDIDE